MVGSFRMTDARFDVSARLEALRHRGPDGSGVKRHGGAVHGHVRLALLDLTDGSAQPYRCRSGVLSFVGEIWNWRELADMFGIKRARSDTQVLAALLAKMGTARLLPVLDGMFAFAWTDTKTGEAVLVRDRFGKIPLYVHRDGERFAWASERKALVGLPCDPLPPGCVLDLTTGDVIPWYVLPRHIEPLLPNVVANLIERGVEHRLVADAPLCCLVSGGVDSSLILALAKRFKPDVVAYTAVLDHTSRDLAAARRVCAELDVPLIEVRVHDPTATDLADAVRAIELPSKAQVEIAALCIPLARAIASDGFKACLSGEAADELFGGYGNMCIAGARADDALWRIIKEKQLAKMARGNFMRCNKAFMAAGVECRLPFMERELVERAVNATKESSPPGKRLLKHAARPVLPEWCVKRPKDTFQGASGMADAAARVVAHPGRFYSAEFATAFR
jgi:asparagine synthase (glutamine-hydrolysing)